MHNIIVGLAALKALHWLATGTIGIRRDAEPDWGYDEHNGAEQWGSICPAYAPCSEGRAQSPIDLPKLTDTSTRVDVHYQPSHLDAFHDFRNVLFNYADGSYIEVDGERYDLQQFHFHIPAEHTVEGYIYPMEVHFVHRNAAGQIAVIGAFIAESESDNPHYGKFWGHLPPVGGVSVQPDIHLNANDLLPTQREYMTYAGSLTMPPCSEGVRWLVLREPVFLSAGQITAFRRVVKFNARPVQPLNGRVVR